MTNYDPFSRGPHPVGVRSFDWTDEARQRLLPVEIWYPASKAHAGQDLDPDTQDKFKPVSFAPEVAQAAVRNATAATSDPHALIVFSHGFGGSARQTTHLCTHWASHGYAVAAMDHVGNTTADMMQMAMGSLEDDGGEESVRGFMSDRPADVSFVIDRLLAGAADLAIDKARIGLSGHSFGGWTTLVTTGTDSRIRAALPLAPAGGQTPLTPPGFANQMADAISLDWQRGVPTLYLVAQFDTLLPLDGMRNLIGRTPDPCVGINLLNADHFHFCDRVEETHDMFKMIGGMLAGSLSEDGPDMQSVLNDMKSSDELCPGEHAYSLLQGLGLAHMDVHLRGNAAALDLLAQDLAALMAEKGVAVEVIG